MTRQVPIFSLAAAVAVAVLLAGCGASEDEQLTPVVDVEVATAEQADFPVSVQAPATVYPKAQASIAARLTAPIRQLRAQKGDAVAAGSVLAELDDRDLQAQRMEAEAAVTDAEANLAKTTGGTLPAEVERARGELTSTQAALDQAQKDRDRRRQLYEQGAIPNRDLLAAETALAQARASFDVAQKSLELLESQSREQDIQMARSGLEQARARLAYVNAQLAFAQVETPFAGSVTEQFLFPGDMAKPDTPIFTVADLSVAVARTQVPETDAASVRRGQQCELSAADAPEAARQGQVTVVNNAVDPQRRTVEVWCEIPNRDGALRAGVFGQVTIMTGTLENAVVVPLEAVQFEEGTRNGVVVVAGTDHKVRQAAVEAGPTMEGKVAILSGLEPGATVIISGGYGLEDGTEVRWEGTAQ